MTNQTAKRDEQIEEFLALEAAAAAEDQATGPTHDPMFVQDKWYEIDTSTLDDEMTEAFGKYTGANGIMRDARKAMETMFAASVAARVPTGLVARFSYRFDKISFSPVVAKAKSTKSGGKITL